MLVTGLWAVVGDALGLHRTHALICPAAAPVTVGGTVHAVFRDRRELGVVVLARPQGHRGATRRGAPLEPYKGIFGGDLRARTRRAAPGRADTVTIGSRAAPLPPPRKWAWWIGGPPGGRGSTQAKIGSPVTC